MTLPSCNWSEPSSRATSRGSLPESLFGFVVCLRLVGMYMCEPPHGPASLKACPGEINVMQIRALKLDIYHIGSAKIRTAQIRFAQGRVLEIGITQVGLLQVGA